RGGNLDGLPGGPRLPDRLRPDHGDQHHRLRPRRAELTAMTDFTIPTAVYESKTEAEQSGPTFVRMWFDALSLAEAEEKDWRDEAERAIKAYRGEDRPSSRSFNIFHSNIETLCPALYNSTPALDVRRRFADADPTAKTVADMLERALAFS